MTEREDLRDYIDSLTEEDARALWQCIQCEEAYPPQPLTLEQIEQVTRSMEAGAAGDRISLDEARRRFGIGR